MHFKFGYQTEFLFCRFFVHILLSFEFGFSLNCRFQFDSKYKKTSFAKAPVDTFSLHIISFVCKFSVHFVNRTMIIYTWLQNGRTFTPFEWKFPSIFELCYFFPLWHRYINHLYYGNRFGMQQICKQFGDDKPTRSDGKIKANRFEWNA